MLPAESASVCDGNEATKVRSDSLTSLTTPRSRSEVEKGRKDGEERGRERSSREVVIMKGELARKSEEVLRQREEMSALVSRCRACAEGSM